MCRAVRLHAAVALELLVPAAHELPQLSKYLASSVVHTCPPTTYLPRVSTYPQQLAAAAHDLIKAASGWRQAAWVSQKKGIGLLWIYLGSSGELPKIEIGEEKERGAKVWVMIHW